MRSAFLLATLFGTCFAFNGFSPTARPLKGINNNSSHITGQYSPLEVQILKQIPSKKRKNYQTSSSQNRLLTMIIHKGDRYIAYIGKQAVLVGDHIGLMIVTDITKNHIILDDGQNEITLTLTGSSYLSKSKLSRYNKQKIQKNNHSLK